MSTPNVHAQFDENIEPGSLSDRLASNKNYGWYVVAMLWLISFFNYADRQAIFSVFPLLEKEFGLSLTAQGALGSSFAIIYGLGAPFAGYIVDKIRRKRAILIGLHIWSIVCVLTATSQKYWHLLFFRAAEGLGESCYYPASMSMVSDYHGKKTRSRAMGFHQTSVYVGTIGGGALAGLLAEHFGWRSSFIVFGTMGIVLGIFLQRLLLEPKRGNADRLDQGQDINTKQPESASIRETIHIIVNTPTLLMLLGAFASANFVASIMLSWMPSYLGKNFGLSLTMAGLAGTAFLQFGSMVGAPLGGYLADRLRAITPRGRLIVQAIGVLGGAPFVLLCGMTTTLSVLIVAMSFWGLFKGLYDANIFASAFDVVPAKARGTTAGVMNCIGWGLGGFPAPIIIGAIGDKYGLPFAIGAASVVYLLSAVFLLTAITFFVKRDSARLQASISTNQ